jgi:hypothetical protein
MCFTKVGPGLTIGLPGKTCWGHTLAYDYHLQIAAVKSFVTFAPACDSPEDFGNILCDINFYCGIIDQVPVS